MENEKIIKICAIIIAIFVVSSFLMSTYYNIKYSIRNHDERKTVCDGKQLVYLKSLQTFNEIIECCAIEEGVLVNCWQFLK